MKRKKDRTKRQDWIRLALGGITLLMGVLLFTLEIQRVGAEHLTTEQEEAFSHLRNQKIRIGYLQQDVLNYRDSLESSAYELLALNVEFIQYESFAELEKALVAGEIEALLNLDSGDQSEKFNWISLSLPSQRFFITNENNPLGDIVNLNNRKIGFRRDTNLYEYVRDKIGDDFDAYFFDTLEEGLDALEEKEIDVFVTRMQRSIEELINRRDLQIEFVFQNKILNVQVASIDEDIYEGLVVFEEIVNSSTRDGFKREFFNGSIHSLKEQIKKYIQETYGDVIARYESIDVGMHSASFPYSYFKSDGTPAGIYLEMLELFEITTGISFNLRNDINHTDFEYLIDGLKVNDIQFLLGIVHDRQCEAVVNIGNRQVQDNIVSIKKYGNTAVHEMPFSEIRYGIIVTHEAFDNHILGGAEYVPFKDYDSAIKALNSGEIDVFLGRRSVLRYYQEVMGVPLLTQVELINRMGTHSMLGHVDNEDLNTLMDDIQRLYFLLYSDVQGTKWENRAQDYQSRYYKLQIRQQQMTGLAMTFFLMLSIYVVYRKSRDNKALRRLTERDHLTQLYNKGTYEKKCFALIRKNPNKLGVFFFIDLDDFKQINDTYGHGVGDDMLVCFARVLRKEIAINKNTICFRIAGDEFGVFSTGYESREEIKQLVKAMQQRVRVTMTVDEKTTIPIRYSAGGSIYNSDTTDFSNLKKYADIAMYQAKRNKGNANENVELFEMGLLKQVPNLNSSADVVDTVLAQKQINAVYQPICGFDSESVYGYEGLSRPTNSSVKNILELMELAEKTDRIHQLDLLMMEKAIRSFKKQGKLFINMEKSDPDQVRDYIEKVAEIANEVELPVEDIVLELSERRPWGQESLQVVMELKQKYNFLLAIDDFGTGFANGCLLIGVKPDIVKIDRYFIQNIHQDKTKCGYVKSFIEFAHNTNIKIACEGIEDQQELELLKELGSDFGQGYYLGKPE